MARLTARERREAYLREYSYQKKTGKPFFPQVILHDIIVNLFFVLLIVGLAILWHATANGTHSGILGPLYEEKADSAVAIYDPRPDWYYFFLFQLLRVFEQPEPAAARRRSSSRRSGCRSWSRCRSSTARASAASRAARSRSASPAQ